MYKFLCKYIDIATIKSCFAVSIIYFLMFNSSVVIYKFHQLNISILHKIFELSKDIITTNLVLCVFFLGFTIHRYIFLLASAILFFTASIASFFLFTKDGYFNFNNLSSNLYSVMNVRLYIWCIFSMGLWLYTTKSFKIESDSGFISKTLSAICLFIFVNSIISDQCFFSHDYFPMQYLHEILVNFFNFTDIL